MDLSDKDAVNTDLSYFAGFTDEKYLKFNKKLITSGYPMLGVRLPVIRQIAKTLKNNTEFLSRAPKTHEEILLYGFALAFSDFEIGELLDRTKNYLQYIDNWATCDSFCAALKKISKHKDTALEYFLPFKNSPAEYERRFLAVIILDYYLCDEYIDKALKILLEIKAGEYYVDMAIAWALATAAAKYFDKVLEIVKSGTLPPFILKRTISKSCESFRLTQGQKEILKGVLANSI